MRLPLSKEVRHNGQKAILRYKNLLINKEVIAVHMLRRIRKNEELVETKSKRILRRRYTFLAAVEKSDDHKMSDKKVIIFF